MRTGGAAAFATCALAVLCWKSDAPGERTRTVGAAPNSAVNASLRRVTRAVASPSVEKVRAAGGSRAGCERGAAARCGSVTAGLVALGEPTHRRRRRRPGWCSGARGVPWAAAARVPGDGLRGGGRDVGCRPIPSLFRGAQWGHKASRHPILSRLYLKGSVYSCITLSSPSEMTSHSSMRLRHNWRC